MKIKLSAALLLFAITAPCQASPNWLTGIGHEVKQTGIDFVTWKHPAWNMMVLAQLGADLADAKTTSDSIKRGNFESSSWLYGKQPDMKRVALTNIGTSIALGTLSHWLHTHTPRPYIKTADYWWIAPQAIDIIGTSRAAWINAGLKGPVILVPPPIQPCHLDLDRHTGCGRD